MAAILFRTQCVDRGDIDCFDLGILFCITAEYTSRVCEIR